MATLRLRAKHFKNATFREPCDCPIYKAAMEQFKLPKNTYVAEGIHYLVIEEEDHAHDAYYRSDYDDDYAIAERHNFDDTIIRNINLPTYEPA